MSDRLDSALVTRIVTVNDDVTGAQFDPVANLSIEVVHDSFCFAVCSSGFLVAAPFATKDAAPSQSLRVEPI